MTSMTVVKNNYLIESIGVLTLAEQRMIHCALSKLDSRSDIYADMEVTALEFAERMNIPIKNSYRELRNSVDRLFERVVVVLDLETNKRRKIRWIDSKAEYIEGTGTVFFTWSKYMIDYISNLKENFTSYNLKMVAELPTVYSFRIYELLMQFKSTKLRIISVDKLKTILGVDKKYPKFKDFNRWILQPSIQSINEQTDIIVEVDMEREKRAVVKLKFNFKFKKIPRKNLLTHCTNH